MKLKSYQVYLFLLAGCGMYTAMRVVLCDYPPIPDASPSYTSSTVNWIFPPPMQYMKTDYSMIAWLQYDEDDEEYIIYNIVHSSLVVDKTSYVTILNNQWENSGYENGYYYCEFETRGIYDCVPKYIHEGIEYDNWDDGPDYSMYSKRYW